MHVAAAADREGEMSHPTRFSLSVLTGILLAAAVLAAIVQTTEPAVRDSPMLVAVTTPTPTAPDVVDATVPTPTTEPDRPVGVPKNPYAAEPIQEIGRIEIPRIGLDQAIFHGITMRNIDRGASHWPGTALPGEVGNSVFAGHRVTHSRPFRRINELEAGDLVHFTVQGVRSTYAVTSHEVVAPTAMRIVDPTPTATATLFACHPPGSARQRYVVRLALLGVN